MADCFIIFVENNLCSLDASGSEAAIRPLFIGQVCFNESPIDKLSIGEWTKSLFGYVQPPPSGWVGRWRNVAPSLRTSPPGGTCALVDVFISLMATNWNVEPTGAAWLASACRWMHCGWPEGNRHSLRPCLFVQPPWVRVPELRRRRWRQRIFFFPDDLIERRWTRQMASTRPKRGVLSEHFRLFGIVNFNYTSTLFRLWTCCVIKFTGKKRKYFDWLIFLYCASFAYWLKWKFLFVSK